MWRQPFARLAQTVATTTTTTITRTNFSANGGRSLLSVPFVRCSSIPLLTPPHLTYGLSPRLHSTTSTTLLSSQRRAYSDFNLDLTISPSPSSSDTADELDIAIPQPAVCQPFLRMSLAVTSQYAAPFAAADNVFERDDDESDVSAAAIARADDESSVSADVGGCGDVKSAGGSVRSRVGGLYASSTLKKRRLKMNKHKYRKRRKRDRQRNK